MSGARSVVVPMTAAERREHAAGVKRIATLMARKHPPCDHARAVRAAECPAMWCPDCGAVFRKRVP